MTAPNQPVAADGVPPPLNRIVVPHRSSYPDEQCSMTALNVRCRFLKPRVNDSKALAHHGEAKILH